VFFFFFLVLCNPAITVIFIAQIPFVSSLK